MFHFHSIHHYCPWLLLNPVVPGHGPCYHGDLSLIKKRSYMHTYMSNSSLFLLAIIFSFIQLTDQPLALFQSEDFNKIPTIFVRYNNLPPFLHRHSLSPVICGARWEGAGDRFMVVQTEWCITRNWFWQGTNGAEGIVFVYGAIKLPILVSVHTSLYCWSIP